jgi:RNase P subunit RPR2
MRKVCDYCENELIYRQIAAFRVHKKSQKLFSPICWTCWRRYRHLQNDETVHSLEFLEERGLLEEEVEEWRRKDAWK